ncbi:MAG: dockerin type I repeat-containing protein [Acutalibacteraceae bacterium]|nr:dockerin type I repeat-containing protein [Acutalibacteraceae bacterium]
MNFKRKSKSMLAVLISALMLAGTTTAFGVEDSVKSATKNIVYQGGGYTATKLSHPTKGEGEVDGIVDYIGNGAVEFNPETAQGERGQSYSWSSVAYGDWVYIGTNYASMISTVNLAGAKLDYEYDADKLESMLNAMYNGNFYTSQEDGVDTKSVLLKINYKTCDVKIIMSKSGTGETCNFRNAVEYKDKLYFCGAVNGLPSVYEIDPTTDEYKMVYQGVTKEENIEAYNKGLSVGIRGICVFDDKLTISCMGLEGAFIATSENPSEGQAAFKKVADMNDLFNYPAYRYCDSIYGGSIWDMIEYNNRLYVSICTGTPENMPDDNTMQSFALVVGEKTADGGISWRALAGDVEKDGARYTFGIDPERTRSGAANLMVYNDYLYIGEYNDEEIALLDVAFKQDFDFMNANLEQSVNLYRMDKNENMELVVGDADNMFPNGSLSGIGSGFERNENQYIWKMCVSDGKLYVGTFDTSSLLEPVGQFSNGEIFRMSTEEWKSQIDYLKTFIRLLLQDSKEFSEFSKVATENKNTVDNPIVNRTLKTKLSVASSSANNLSNEQIQTLAEDMVGFDISNIDAESIENYDKYIEQINALIAQLESEVENEDYTNAEVNYQKALELYNQLITAVQENLDQSDIGTEEYNLILETITNAFKSLFNKENQSMITGFLKNSKYLSVATKGFDLYVTEDGINFETITIDGFGDEYNHGLRTTAPTEDGIVIGTANPFYGTQVWLLSEDPTSILGDINNDGNVDLIDVAIIQKSLLGYVELDEAQKIAGDVNLDQKVDLVDTVLLQKYLLDYNTGYPIGDEI